MFEFDGPPLRMYNCHCSRCRRAVSAGYQTVVRARLGGFRWLAGPEKITGYRMPGTRFECAFCTACGSRTPWERGEQVCVPAGCLDNDPAKKPSDNIFTVSRAAWTGRATRDLAGSPSMESLVAFAANHIVIHSPSVQ
ncbi:MAG: GFA family protein [Gammaproteobacteria bacterium]|nr:GFA family protein [Gammaproteobacteria bacterium]